MLRPSQSTPLTLLRGLVGALLGAVVGYFAFALVVRFGFVIVALPGALVGIGCGLATGRRSPPAGVLAGIIALALSIFIEWKFFHFPVMADDSFGYFIRHLHETPSQTQVMIALGTLGGIWFGWGRSNPQPASDAA